MMRKEMFEDESWWSLSDLVNVKEVELK